MRVEEILKAVAMTGVREICLCAGARNAPFVFALEKAQGLQLYDFFEERSAAFFALGRSRQTRRPVAVITTSGTAAAELLPAAIEAYYQNLPLLLITADRPRHFRGSGAPQAIEQTGLFSHYTVWQADVENENPRLELWRKNGPAHLNVCLPDPPDEPERPVWLWPLEESAAPREEELDTSAVEIFFQQVKKPLVFLSGLEKNASLLEEVLAETAWPIYAEGPSGLRESRKLAERIFRSGDILVSKALAANEFDGVIRIGGVPTLRAWRDLDEELTHLPVLNFSDQGWSGLGRMKDQALPISNIGSLVDYKNKFSGEPLLEKDRKLAERLEQVLQECPHSEAALIRKLSHQIEDQVYIGNSLPIREWDIAASFERPIQVIGNRGANGIDGQLSTFYAMAMNWGIFGDLTALYDLPSPWALKYSPTPKNTVIINNGGGEIFRRKFSSPRFLNTHHLQFHHWAEMWGLEYEQWQKIPESSPTENHRVIEIQPDAEQNERFWQGYRELHR